MAGRGGRSPGDGSSAETDSRREGEGTPKRAETSLAGPVGTPAPALLRLRAPAACIHTGERPRPSWAIAAPGRRAEWKAANRNLEPPRPRWVFSERRSMLRTAGQVEAKGLPPEG